MASNTHRNGTGLVSYVILRLALTEAICTFGSAVAKRTAKREIPMIDFVVSLFTFVFYAHHSTESVLD
jgi:hypothetical protein